MQSRSSVSQTMSPFFLEKGRKRFQHDEIEHRPVIVLDREGTIQSLTKAARQLLEYGADAHVETCFFSHVHKRNMRRVMRDLAHMVCQGKQRAQWLLRLRTGNRRWRWYRASVENNLAEKDDHILVELRRL